MSNRTEVVWKYLLPEPGPLWAHASWPEGAEVVHVALQEGRIHAWLRVRHDAPTEDVLLMTVGTGVPVSASAEHLGTVITAAGFVWHAFARRGV